MIRLWIAGVCLLAAALPVRALDLEGFKIEQVVVGGDYPEIHVKFDRAADNWKLVTNDTVKVKVKYELTVKAAYALQPSSSVTIDLDGMVKEMPLLSSNSDYSEFHTGTASFSRAGNALTEIRAVALATCQLIRGNGGLPSKEHRIPKSFKSTAMADASTTAPAFTEAMANDTTFVRVDVVCDLDPDWHQPVEPKGLGVATEQGRFKPISIQLFLTTYQNQVSHPTPGTNCKKLEVKVRIETNKAGQLSYKLWRQPGEARSRTRFVEFQDSGPFKGRFVLEEVFVDTFDATTYVQYMAETAANPFGVSTQWKDINIRCTSAGGGGLTGGSSGGGNPPAARGFKAPTVTPPPPPVPPTKKAPQP